MRNPIEKLRAVLEGRKFTVNDPILTSGRPRVLISGGLDEFNITFKLKTIVPNQTFLGIYPTPANLPDAKRLAIGDYAVLSSGEVVQNF